MRLSATSLVLVDSASAATVIASLLIIIIIMLISYMYWRNKLILLRVKYFCRKFTERLRERNKKFLLIWIKLLNLNKL